MDRVPYGLNNNLQIKLENKGKDVEDFVNRMRNMDDQEIASELDINVTEARDLKRELSRGMVAGEIIVD